MQENLKGKVFDVLDIENINKKNKNEAIKYILNRENFLKKDIFDVEKFSSIFKTVNISNKEYKILSRDPQKKENSLKIIEKQMRNMGISNDKILEMINHVDENTNPVYSEKVEKK